jgi:hypothetical protein
MRHRENGPVQFLASSEKSLQNSHQSSHSTKIKMAADLAASHLIDYI